MEQGSLEEARARLGRARETLDAARVLMRESYRAEAVSRCYYAMFYAARALLIRHGLTVHKHSAVVSAIGREFANQGLIDRELHRAFLDAYRERNRADYSVLEEFSDATIAARLATAEVFVRQVAERLAASGQS